MKTPQRQAIAAVAACIAKKCSLGNLIDEENNQTIQLSVKNKGNYLEVLDQHANLLQVVEHKLVKWSIFDRRSLRYIDLEESGKDFKGYDYESAHYFTLQFIKNRICIYDYESDDYHYFRFANSKKLEYP